MALRRILKFPEPVLKQTATDVANIDGQIDEVLRDMVETMYAAPGVGLAAPQVGVGERMIVVDVDTENPGKHLLKLINPVIVEREGTILWEEGCLSVVDYTAEVRRSARILLKAWTRRSAGDRDRSRRPARGRAAARDRPPRRQAVHRPDQRAQARLVQAPRAAR